MTEYGLKVDISNLSEGAPVEIPLLGEFANVGIYELDESRLRAFLISIGKGFEDLESMNWPQGVTLMVAKKEPVSKVVPVEEPATEKAQEGSK